MLLKINTIHFHSKRLCFFIKKNDPTVSQHLKRHTYTIVLVSLRSFREHLLNTCKPLNKHKTFQALLSSKITIQL